MKQKLLNHIKNIYGWKTKRKIVVFSVDDYGNVRLDSRQAREQMDKEGMKVWSRFDAFDTLETREDLEMLYETLSSVKDKNGRHAVFTPFALPANINFEKMAQEGNKRYVYELLPETYRKLESIHPKAYKGTWQLWKEGIASGLMKPQFHGREHLNLKVFEEKLQQNDKEVLTALKHRSYTSISSSGYPTINYTAAFDFWDPKENKHLSNVLVDGLLQFHKVFGAPAAHLMAPTSKIYPALLDLSATKGIKYVDIGLIHKQHIGFGKHRYSINYTGKKRNNGQVLLVRNVVFEPTQTMNRDHVAYAIAQIETAFRHGKPAIISSHRVNFSGHISEENRNNGIDALKELLQAITSKWPDVEFMSSDQLASLIYAEERKAHLTF